MSQHKTKRRVVVTGLGTINPLGNDVADHLAKNQPGRNRASIPSPLLM
jgi:3-oxoacyl-(acyl-carrier-protein) synthase